MYETITNPSTNRKVLLNSKLGKSILSKYIQNAGGRGKVYIASMKRGVEQPKLPPNTIKLNVTSAQLKENLDRKAFSPMTAIEGGYKGFLNFEGYWQSGKVFEGIPEQSVKKFWREKKDAGRKYPGSTGKRVLYAKFHDIDKKYDYITSRKEVYIPQYYALIQNNERLAYWKQKVEEGNNIAIYDFDGPHNEDRSNSIMEVTNELLRNKVNDPRFPFGHGYIISGILAGINVCDYIN